MNKMASIGASPTVNTPRYTTNARKLDMKTISVPTRDQVSADNQVIFDNLKSGLGFVPNLYATIAHSKTALGT